MENTWLAACCTEEMLSLRMLTLQLQQSRLRDPSNLLTGVQLDSRLESTTNHQLLFQEVILPRSNVPSACCPTPLLLLKHGLVWIISSILCTPNVLSSTGMLEKVWKKENSLKPVRTWLHLRRITKKLVWIPSKVKMKEKNTKPTYLESLTKDDFKILN